jgi:hypothetical protein
VGNKKNTNVERLMELLETFNVPVVKKENEYLIFCDEDYILTYDKNRKYLFDVSVSGEIGKEAEKIGSIPVEYLERFLKESLSTFQRCELHNLIVMCNDI